MSDWLEKDEYKAAVRDFVAERDHVSFAALHIHFAPEAREETQIALPGNRIVWTGLPKALFDAILELVDGGELAAVPAHKSHYARDGRVLSLPVEKTIPPEGHAEPHWFPVVLRPMQAVLDEEAG